MNDFDKVSTLIADFQRRLYVIITRDGTRDMQDAHIPLDLFAVIEDDLLPILDRCIECIEYDPTPEHVWDNSSGEPPVTMTEMHSAGHAQHIAMHS